MRLIVSTPQRLCCSFHHPKTHLANLEFTMDYINKLTGSGNDAENNSQDRRSEGFDTNNANQEGNSGGGFMDKMNSMAGGGAQGEKNEDMLDKG